MRHRLQLLLLPLAAIAVACGTDPGENSPDAGQPALELGQGSEPRGALIVNEVHARPTSGEDWLELYNRSDSEIDLCDYFLTDSLDRLDHYLHLGGAAPPQACPPTHLAAGAYLVVYADDNRAAGPDHAPFKLGAADEAHVVSVQGEPLDSLIFLHPGDADGLSLSRQPNGEGLFWVSEASAGEDNPGAAGDSL